MAEYSVLIIGCGKIAGGFDAERPADAMPLTHAGAYVGHGSFRLRACVDPNAARCQAFVKRWRVEGSATSVAALGAAPGSFDVISVCSPNDFHAGHLEAALALRPRLIFCEKPVTTVSVETERWVMRCEAEGVKLAVNYTRRWAPDVVLLADELRRGVWGRVLSATGVYTKGILHNGSHMVDLLHFLLGPMQLVAAGKPRFDFWEGDPTVPALIESEAGVPIHLAVGDANDYALFELLLLTERGEIAMRDGGRNWTVRSVGNSTVFAGYRELGALEMLAGNYDAAMSQAVVNIAAALAEDEPLSSSGTSALAAQRLCEAIRGAAVAKYSTQTRTN